MEIKNCVKTWSRFVHPEKFLVYMFLFKKEWQHEFFQKAHFLKICPDSKQDIRKSWDLHSVLYKWVWGSVKKNFWKMCDIEANIEFFAFLNCCDPTFSQIEIIIKFLNNFVKEGLNFSQMALCEGLYIISSSK